MNDTQQHIEELPDKETGFIDKCTDILLQGTGVPKKMLDVPFDINTYRRIMHKSLELEIMENEENKDE